MKVKNCEEEKELLRRIVTRKKNQKNCEDEEKL